MNEGIFEALLAGSAISGFDGSVEQTPQGPSFKIRIPKGHPKVEQLLKLANFLASRIVTEGGIEIDRAGGPCLPADAESMMLDLLREIVDPEHIDRLLADCVQFSRERKATQFFEAVRAQQLSVRSP